MPNEGKEVLYGMIPASAKRWLQNQSALRRISMTALLVELIEQARERIQKREAKP